VMICVHGSLDPVKDASPVCMRDEKALVLGCVRLFSAPADVVPLLGRPEDIRCHRCGRRQERSSCQRDGPV
jgi:hypothetical protein